MSIPNGRNQENSASDVKLAQSLAEGDEEALATLVRRYAPNMAAWCSQFLGSFGTPEDVEEVVSDSFIYVWNHPAEYDPGRGSVSTWLWWIVRARASARGRAILRDKRWIKAEGNDVPITELASTDFSESLAGELDARIRLKRAISDLSQRHPEDAVLIAERFLQQRSHAEIAERLQVTDTAARVRLYRAMKRLRTILEKEEYT